MSSETVQQVLQMIQSAADSKPSAIEFEMAYQARVAADRIRFAIKQIESLADHNGVNREVSFQLVEALQRLDAVDRRFLARSGTTLDSEMHAVANGDVKARRGDRINGTD